MRIGFGIFLMVAGAILAFGVRDRSDAINLPAVGVILILAGAAGIWLSYTISSKRRHAEALDESLEVEHRTVRSTGRIRAYVSRRPRPAPTAVVTPSARSIDLDPAASGLPAEPAAAEPAEIVETPTRVTSRRRRILSATRRR